MFAGLNDEVGAEMCARSRSKDGMKKLLRQKEFVELQLHHSLGKDRRRAVCLVAASACSMISTVFVDTA